MVEPSDAHEVTLDPDAPMASLASSMTLESEVATTDSNAELAAASAREHEQARRRAEQLARQQAEQRREAEASKFEREQAEAKASTEQRAAETAAKRRDAARAVKDKLYGTFRKK